MKLDLRRYLALVVAASIVSPVLASDDDYYEPTSLTAPSESAPAEATQVGYNETSFLEDESATDLTPSCAVDAPPTCCRPLSCYLNTKPITNPYQGFNFSIDSTFMKPHVGALSSPLLLPGTLLTPTYDYTFAPRYNLGYEGENGLGIRFRYWSLAQGSNNDANPGGIGITARTQAETIDIDITQRIVFQKWNFLVGSGMRSVNTRNTLSVAVAGINISDNFDGWGPNFFLEANRPLGDTKLSLYTFGRGSLLFGQTAFDLGATQALVSNDTVMTTYELGAGIQWKGDMLFSKAGIEAQMWNQGQVAGLIGLDYGYVGPSTSIGIIF